MCKSCSRKRRSKKRKGSIGAIDIAGLDINRAIGIGGGAVAAKLLNTPAKKYLAKYITDDPTTAKNEGRLVRLALAGGKIIGGLLINTRVDNELVQDAGLGMAAVGGIELFEELAPNINLNGVTDSFESVGNVLEIDLDSLEGTQETLNLESTHAVAGYDPTAMEIAGADSY